MQSTGYAPFGPLARARGEHAGWTALVAALLAACAPITHEAAVARAERLPASDHALAGRLAVADAIVAGVLTKAQRDIRYESPCGIIARVMHRCDDTQAYDARIRAFDGHEWELMFFRLGPGPHPALGDSAVWVLHRDAVYPYLTCAQRVALTSTGCLGQPSFVLESDDDVLPLSEWPRVQRLLAALSP